jgi:hypothetical protein
MLQWPQQHNSPGQVVSNERPQEYSSPGQVMSSERPLTMGYDGPIKHPSQTITIPMYIFYHGWGGASSSNERMSEIGLVDQSRFFDLGWR